MLIRGESGSGKELVARAIHYTSQRKEGPFVCLNCAALTETLLESELFGHEKGSFTGATEKKIGKFEAADHGTIFLDEIGEMNVGTQAKLLRILEGHPFERVGGSVPIRVDVRVVAATNQPLEQAIHAGHASAATCSSACKWWRSACRRCASGKTRRARCWPTISSSASCARRAARSAASRRRRCKKMEDYHWPGNVRELRNVVERAVALANGPMLDAADIWLSSLDAMIPPASRDERLPADAAGGTGAHHILRTLEHTDWNKSQAADILDIERSTLDRKIKLYELKR